MFICMVVYVEVLLLFLGKHFLVFQEPHFLLLVLIVVFDFVASFCPLLLLFFLSVSSS